MSAVEPLRIAVVGFGKLGLLHAALANAVPSAKLAAVVDSTPMMLDALKAYMPDVRVYGDYRALLNEGSGRCSRYRNTDSATCSDRR